MLRRALPIHPRRARRTRPAHALQRVRDRQHPPRSAVLLLPSRQRPEFRRAQHVPDLRPSSHPGLISRFPGGNHGSGIPETPNRVRRFAQRYDKPSSMSRKFTSATFKRSESLSPVKPRETCCLRPKIAPIADVICFSRFETEFLNLRIWHSGEVSK